MLNKKIKFASLLAAVALSSNLSAQLSLKGSETQVNTTTTHSQQNPSVSMDSLANIVSVWESYDATNKKWEIHRQLFNSDGTVNGSETELFSNSLIDYRYPKVATSKNGMTVVAYMSEEDNNATEGWNSYWRVYNADGTVFSSSSRMSSSSSLEQVFPDVDITDDASYSVGVYQEISSVTQSDIYFRQMNSTFAHTSSSVQVNTTSGNMAMLPKVSVDTDGEFVVVWQYQTGDNTKQFDIYAQRFDASRSAIGSEFVVNTTTDGWQTEPDVAYGKDGEFCVVWTSNGQDGDHQGVYRQRYDANGNKIGSETKVNSTTSNAQNHPAISATYGGFYNITWSSYAQDGDRTGVYYLGLDSAGNTIIAEAKINTRTNDFQQFSEIAQSKHDSSVVVIWQDGLRNSSSTHDGDDYGVYMQRVSVKDTVDPAAVCKNTTVYLNASGYALLDSAAIDGGTTDNYTYFTISLSQDTVKCADLDSKIITMTATDLAGNSDACLSQVNILDTIAPVVACQDLTVYLDATGNASITAADVDNGTTDNCTLDSVTIDVSSFTCGNIGANTVVLKGYDNSGNVDSCEATVTVVDSVSPSLTAQNLTIYLDGTGNASMNSIDAVGSSSDVCGISSTVASDTTFDCAQVGTFRIGVTVTDLGGNTTTDSSQITLLDTITPTVLAQDFTIYLNPSGYAEITSADADNGSTDNCSFSLKLSDSTFTCSDLGANSVSLTATDASGNASVANFTLTVLDTVSPTKLYSSICEGDSLLLGGVYQTTAGSYNDTLSSVYSCDSIITTVLTVNPTYFSASSQAICEGDSLMIFGEYRKVADTYLDTLSSVLGCDSILSVELTINNNDSTTANESICDGDVYDFGLQKLSTAGTYFESFESIGMCDSVVTLNLTVNPTYNHTHQLNLCDGDSYNFGSQVITGEDAYFNTFTSVDGCDSAVVLEVTMVPTYAENQSASICNGESYTLGAQTLSSTGVYNETFQSVYGCDSVVTLTLTVKDTFSTAVSQTICDGETYILGTQNLTSTGVYSEVFPATNGCDSTVELSLTVAPTYSTNASHSICDGDVYSFGAQNLNTTGNYVETFQSVNGCDSTVNLSLTVDATVSTIDTIRIQPGDSSLIHGNYEKNEGTYIQTFSQSSSAACDSVSTVELIWDLTVGVDALGKTDISVYPNPSKGNVFVGIDRDLIGVYFKLYNELGQIVKQGQINTTIFDLEMNNYEGGVYYINFIKPDKDFNETKQIVLTK